jgi:hypothetical protein
MTRTQQVLKEALKRGRENGFVLKARAHLIVKDNITGEFYGWETWVLSPDFAKAFFGNGIVHPNKSPTQNNPTPVWYLHLQDMVVMDNADRIEHLAKELGI